MRFRNRDRFSMKTPYDPLAAIGMLRAHTDTRQHGGGREDISFRGDIPFGAMEFELCPVDGLYRNSWRPILRCVLRPEKTGAVLEVEARCGWFTRIFTGIWYTLLVLMTLGMLLDLLFSGVRWELLVLAAIWAWGFFLPHFAFWIPMKRAKRELCRILNAELSEK